MTVLNLAITSGSDDARQTDTDDVSITATSFIVDDIAEYIAFRFVNVTIDQGSTISSAVLQPYITSGATDEPAIDIYAEASDDAPALAAVDNDISDRVPTSAVVQWHSADLATAGGFVSAPDISSVIQEIVDQPGWVSGNAICIIITQTNGFGGTRDFGVDFYDLNSNRAAKLDITHAFVADEYTETGSGGSVAGSEANASLLISSEIATGGALVRGFIETVVESHRGYITLRVNGDSALESDIFDIPTPKYVNIEAGVS